ncbi:MAG: glycosyltransferase [Proteobacteria bacterium]|nr:glycosyltransferase [Pseudomonadota bacterium]
MFQGLRVAVVIPAFNEETLIVGAVRGIPSFVDDIVVVDDASSDSTAERVQLAWEPRLHLLKHDCNRGVGAAVVTGYARAF